ncbi:MAG TPA: hypothetical protein VMQ83_10800 [Gammaproteobacteria bacterium]|nr:hypothetical protein [Gammaproteobacteria bacterium]
MSTHSSVPRGARAAFLATFLLAGCASQVPYPADWDPKAGSGPGCPALSGRFRNLPAATSDNDAAADGLPLTQIFFASQLEGFEVTHLEFESLPGGRLRITPWVGATKLREERIVAPGEASCEDNGWVFTTGWDVNGLMIADGIIWTAGILVPAARKWSFAFGHDAHGRLVVHAVARIGGTVLLIVPFNSRQYEAWFSYVPYLPGVDSHGE